MLRLPAQRSTDHIVHVKRAARLLGTHIALIKGKDSALGNHEQAAQFRQPRDDVVGKAIGQAAARTAMG